MVDTSGLGETINTACGSVPTVVIGDGPAADKFTAPGEGGLPLTDFGGDLGAYLDAMVVPLIDSASPSFVYLQSAGFGINNSSDPIYFDSVGYDIVIIAEQAFEPDGDFDGDGDVDLADYGGFQRCFTGPGAGSIAPGCERVDFDSDVDVDLDDYAEFEVRFTGVL
jgi:hypothetical protein